MDTETEYIDLYDAAAELGVSMATMWNLIKRHELIRYRLPGKRRAVIRRSDLEILKQPIPIEGAARGRPRGTGTKKLAA